MKNFEIGAIVLGMVAGTVQAEPVQWSVADGGNGHWYEAVLTDTGLTWEQAQQLANGDNGYLATPVTAEENLWISITLLDGNGDLFGSAGYGPHIGGIQNTDSPDYSEPYGGWEWASGDDWGYDNWTACDNCCGGQARMQYMSQFTESGNGWGDVSYGDSNSQFKSYVVEWDHDPSIIQWRIEDGGNGHWYQLVESGKGFLWSEAVAEAESRGGYLVSLTSADEDAWVYANFDADNRWIGVFQDTNAADYSEPSGGWRWLSGETSDYSNWNGGGPDNGGVADAPAEEYAHYCCGGAWNDIYGVDSFGVFVRKQMMVEYTTLPGSALGACCLDGLCITTAAADCSGNSGSWGGPNSSCADFDCPENCPSDVNGDGLINVNDLLLLIGSWGVCP